MGYYRVISPISVCKSGWYYDKKELKQTPSILAGLSFEQEVEQRREGARFIMNVGNKMGLRYETMATGVVYFHRFYMVHTFQEFPRHVTACCCLFLAGKVEETPKKCRDIMKMAKANMDEVTWAEFGIDPREEVMTLERILLQTIKFDFIVEHPYSYLLKYAKGLKGDKKKLPNMVQMAWTFVNDSMCTTLCLQWEPEIIAIALMYLAGKLSKFEVTDWAGRIPKQEKWWDMYVSGITLDLLEDICHQVLDLYSPNRGDGGAGSGLGGSATSSGSSSSKNASSISVSSLSANVAPSSGPTSGAMSSSTSGTSSNSNSAEPPSVKSGSQKRAVTPTKAASQPPAKKAKKEEVKSSPAKPSPVKQESSSAPQSYQYPYPSYSGYPPSYNPPQSSSSSSSSSTTPRYPPYSYPPTTTQGPPPPSQVPPPVPPPSYQPTQRHYPPPATGTPQAPPHYTSQPPPTHYSSSSHPPYPPPTTSHYTAPPPTNYPPPSHGSSSSYYQPPPSTSNPPPTYPQTGPSSSYAPPSSHSYSHSHSSSRSYYPPS